MQQHLRPALLAPVEVVVTLRGFLEGQLVRDDERGRRPSGDDEVAQVAVVAGDRALPAQRQPATGRLPAITRDPRPPAAIGFAASAGGVEALMTVIGALPADLDAAVLVVLHIAPIGPSVLPAILARHGRLPAEHPEDGERLAAGHVYVAPPDRHLVVAGERVRVVAGPKENGNRPAADPMLRSLAQAFGPASAGVVLSGSLDDGTVGLAAIKRAGGLTVAQDPAEAAFPGMPAHAVSRVHPDHVLPLAGIAPVLVEFVSKLTTHAARGDELRVQDDADDDRHQPTGLTCPDCGGALWVTD